MRKILIALLIVIGGFGFLGYQRGWFEVTAPGKVEIQIDQEKFKEDKRAFGKSVEEKTRTMKERIAALLEKSKRLPGDDKTRVQKELDELKKKHDRLEKQLKELEETGHDKFESLKDDLSKNLAEVEKKIEDSTKILEK